MNSITDIARIAGRFAWLEDRIADVTGAWVASIDHSDARLVFGSRSHTHAWHAELWKARIPELRATDALAHVAPASPALSDFIDRLAAADSTVERMVGTYRVLLPRLVTAYALLLRETNEVIDAPTVRTLRLVLEDTREEVREGEVVLRSLADASEATAVENRLAAVIDAAGPLAG